MFGFGKKKNGLETEHYPNGQKKSEINYPNGYRDGYADGSFACRNKE